MARGVLLVLSLLAASLSLAVALQPRFVVRATTTPPVPSLKNIPPVLGGLKAGFKKLCVVTGASSGLGLEAAKVLAENDEYFVICAVRNPEKMKAVAN